MLRNIIHVAFIQETKKKRHLSSKVAMAIAQLLHTNLLKVAVLFVEEPRVLTWKWGQLGGTGYLLALESFQPSCLR